eukprot:4767056-Prymnesium_polylepis.2
MSVNTTKLGTGEEVRASRGRPPSPRIRPRRAARALEAFWAARTRIRAHRSRPLCGLPPQAIHQIDSRAARAACDG